MQMSEAKKMKKVARPAAQEATHDAGAWAETADLTVNCKDCAADFVFSGSEQDWFVQKGFSVATRVRCAECIKARKERYAEKTTGGDASGVGQASSGWTTQSDTPDLSVSCKDCSADFVFPGVEQDWFVKKGWDVAAKGFERPAFRFGVRCPAPLELR